MPLWSQSSSGVKFCVFESADALQSKKSFSTELAAIALLRRFQDIRHLAGHFMRTGPQSTGGFDLSS